MISTSHPRVTDHNQQPSTARLASTGAHDRDRSTSVHQHEIVRRLGLALVLLFAETRPKSNMID